MTIAAQRQSHRHPALAIGAIQQAGDWLAWARSLVGAIMTVVRAAAVRRRKRIVLNELMLMKPGLLEDIGLDKHDIVEALKSR